MAVVGLYIQNVSEKHFGYNSTIISLVYAP